MQRVTVSGKTYDFEQDDLTNLDMMRVEEATGTPFGAWADGLNARSMRAITGLVWLLQSRENPDLRFEDVVFRMADFDIEDVPEEDSEGKAEAPSPAMSTTI